MSYRLISYDLADIAINPDVIAHNLTHACNSGNERHVISGVFQGLHTVFFTRVPATTTEADTGDDAGKPDRYVLVPFVAAPAEELVAELGNRVRYGFTPIGLITLDEVCLALYRTTRDDDEST